MDNFSKITLTAEKIRLDRKISALRKSFNSLQDNTTEFAEHHQYMINTYVELKHKIILAIKESEDIGSGL